MHNIEKTKIRKMDVITTKNANH